jgi:Zn-dependent alcohol dehydrogenase
VTVGVTKGEHIAQAFDAVGKSGTVVVTGLGDLTEVGIPIPIGMLTLFAKEIKGALFGDQNPSTDILKMLRLYQEGKLKLDELITNRYKLEDINQGYEDMHAGKNIRGVIIYD